jgi:hypothetical protein
MADRSGAAEEVRGVVAVPDTSANGTVTEGTVARSNSAKNDPDALVAQIEHTREDLARTIDALADRVSPASNIRLLREKAMQQVSRPEVQLGAVAAGLAVTGLFVLRVWARRRRAR